MARTSSYKAADIEVLEGLEPVRKRPGMYIGGTEGPAGLHHLLKEILDNAVDEAMNGFADLIDVTLHEDGESITVTDNGRGIPVDTHPKFKKPALEIILTTLHAGGKFSDQNYVSAGGLHGVGASVVNALSERLEAIVCRDGHEWRQEFSRGKTVSGLKKLKKTSQTGTSIFFRPDTEIFRSIRFSSDRIESILQEKAFLNKGLKINFKNETDGSSKSFCFKEGLKSYLESILKKQNIEPMANEIFVLERANGIKVEIAFCWTESTKEKVLSYVNGIHTGEGGSHEDGFRSGLSKAIRNYMQVHDVAQKNLKVTGEDMREGMIGIISVNVPGSVTQLQFQGQTKDKLNNPEVTAPVEALTRSVENYLNSKPTVAAAVIERIQLAAKARAAARSAAESVSRKVGVSHRLNLPGKLADCSSTRPDKSELFIVEGDSAGGSAKQGRDRNIQAVLPLRGKILNAVAASDAKLKENKEVLDLISALGCGFGEHMKLDKLRYGKVIILTDADADGMHIASLLMALFFKFMRPLVRAGHLYVALSPLYRIRIGSGAKEEIHWVYSDEEKEKLLKSRSARGEIHITRFKGLGEMNPKALWETTLNPATRNLLRIQIDDEQEVTSVLEGLLGKDSAERYRLIQENADRLELDV
ncbi:MAG: type IIA DNA topoisomerase subunit B [Deltaproteobacteria bacterium]|nr:type IIA DNA topoisomerase subunit B [Deltaproteobacteria bacterium]